MDSILQRDSFRSLTSKAIFLLALGLLSVLIGRPKEFNITDGWDFQGFWVAPHLLLEGGDPYNPQEWLQVHNRFIFPRQDDVFIYPLPLAVLLLPLGLLPLEIAGIVWMGMAILAVFLSSKLVLSWLKVRWSNSYFLPVLAGLYLFRPVAVTFYIHQIDTFILFFLAGATYLWKKERWFWGGALIAVTIVKPQIGAPILLLTGIWLLVKTRFAALAGIGAVLICLLLSGLLFDLDWVWRFLTIGGSKVSVNFYSTPTVWGLSSLVCKPDLACVRVLGAILASVTLLLALWIILGMKTSDVDFAISIIAAGTVLASPYLWTYSQSLLVIPIMMITVAVYRSRKPYLITATIPTWIAILSLGMVWVAALIGADIFSAIIPVTIWGLILLVYHSKPQLLSDIE